MRISTHPGLRIRGPIIAWFFYEHLCPICRFVKMTVLLPLQAEGVIDIRPFEVIDNDFTPEMQWFHNYSENVGGAITPTIRLVDIYQKELDYRYAPIQVLHLWDVKKGKYLAESDIAKSKLLYSHIIEAIKKYRRKIVRETHDMSLEAKITVPSIRAKRLYRLPLGETMP